MGRLLGFPACCIAFFRRVWVNDGCVDTMGDGGEQRVRRAKTAG
jgi:hypothetical protein